MLRLALIAAVSVLAGCATPTVLVWTKTRPDAAALEPSKMECEFQAEAASPNVGGSLANMVDRSLRVTDLTKRCMAIKGWTQVRQPAAP